MKFYLISDNVDTLMGMHLAGIDGVVVHEDSEVRETLQKAMEMPDVAVILMTERLVQLCPELVYARPQAQVQRGEERRLKSAEVTHG